MSFSAEKGTASKQSWTHYLPPPALSGSGSKGTSQPFGAPGRLVIDRRFGRVKPLSCVQWQMGGSRPLF